MFIQENEYFKIKEDTAEAIDITFSIRKKSISNIARLYADEVVNSYNEFDRYVSDVIFYYLIWKKFNGLSNNSLQHIKQITHKVLSIDADFFHLNPEEYDDFIKLATELNSADISVLTDENMD